MGQTADKITRILQGRKVQPILDALGEPEERESYKAAARLVSQMEPSEIQSLATVEIAHAIDRVETQVGRTNGSLSRLKEAHDNVMSGNATGCRHLADLRISFWKFLAVTVGLPLILLVLWAILSLAYFGEGK